MYINGTLKNLLFLVCILFSKFGHFFSVDTLHNQNLLELVYNWTQLVPFLVHLGHLMEYASLIAPLSVIFLNEKETNAVNEVKFPVYLCPTSAWAEVQSARITYDTCVC